MAAGLARVYTDPFVNYLINSFNSTAKIDSDIRVNGQDTSLYNLMWNVVKYNGPPVAAVASIVGKVFVNTAPATIDYLDLILRDANMVAIGELQIQAVSDPISISSPGEYIVNITIYVSAPTSVSVTVT
jgi:hypothetical protein